MNSLKTIAVGLTLSIGSLLALALALEAALRLTVDQPSELYADLTYDRALDTEFYRRSFLELYPRNLDWRRDVYDPYLGWDQPYNSITRGSRTVGAAIYDLQPAEDVLRVVAIGDSFVFGSYVDSDETYPAQLETLLDDGEVLNMGVVGYGIDQAVLKYQAYGEQYDPDVVLLGTFPHNYIRTALPFYGFAKPLFAHDESAGIVRLTNTDIPPPQEVYDALDRELDPPALYSVAFLRNRLTRVYWRLFGQDVKEQYHRDVDRIIEHVLHMLQESTEPPNGRETHRGAGAARHRLSRRGGVAARRRGPNAHTPDRPLREAGHTLRGPAGGVQATQLAPEGLRRPVHPCVRGPHRPPDAGGQPGGRAHRQGASRRAGLAGARTVIVRSSPHQVRGSL